MGTDRGGAILAIADVVAGDANYRLSDSAVNYADADGVLAAGVADVLAAANEVTIDDPASVAQAVAVWYQVAGTLTLAAGLADRAENYAAVDGTISDAFIALLLSATIADVTISDAATVAQAAMVWNNNAGTLTLSGGLSDSARHYAATDGALAPDVAQLLALNPDVTIVDAASVAQLAALSDATDGSLAYAGIADTAANLASYFDGAGWEVNGYVLDGIEVTVSGAIDAAEIAAIDLRNGDAAVILDPTFLSAPNAFLIETPTEETSTIARHMVANLIDAAGAQEIRIASGGKLNLIGADGHNLIVFEGVALADLVVTHSGATAIFSIAADSTQIASIATDASYAPAQTLAFSDGSYELTNDGSSLALGGVEITLVGSLL